MKRLWVILFVLPLFGQKPLKYSISFPEINQSNMPVLFLMHGYGNNEKQFNELIEALDNKYLIVSMRAPFKFMVISNRWYEYSISDGDTLSNQVQIDVSTNRIIKTIEHIKRKYNIDEKKIFI
jgi:phospholipase/carboxylesterase